MNGATQKIEQLDNDRITVTELIQVEIILLPSIGADDRLSSSKRWIRSLN